MLAMHASRFSQLPMFERGICQTLFLKERLILLLYIRRGMMRAYTPTNPEEVWVG